MAALRPSSPGYDDPLGLGWWNSDDSNGAGIDRRKLRDAPDLGSRSESCAWEEVPPRSAPLWLDTLEGCHAPEPTTRSGRDLPKPRSNIVRELWHAINRQGSDAISKATYIRIHIEIHARMRKAGSTPALPSADTTNSELYDLRSVAETSWTTNSKGLTTMNFDQFEQAWITITEGVGEADRHEVFYSIVREVFCQGGEPAHVSTENQTCRSGCLSPSRLQARTPLKGSFPDGYGQQAAAAAGVGRKGSLLMSAWSTLRETGSAGLFPSVLDTKEPTMGGDARTACSGKQAEKAAPPDRALDVGAGERAASSDTKNIRASAGHESQSHRTWPPAWVKLTADAHAARDIEDKALVVAKGMFGPTVPPPQQDGATAKPVDARGLKGSAKQKARWLQQQLMHDRVRLQDVQRNGASRVPAAGPPAQQHREASNLHYPTAADADASATTATAARNPSPLILESPLYCTVVGSSVDCCAGNKAESEDETRADGLDAGVIAGSLATSLEASTTTGTGGSSVGVFKKAFLTTATRSGETAADFGNGGGHQFLGGAEREKPLVLACTLCRQRESALWCQECRATFCVACFEAVPHHRGTGLLSNPAVALHSEGEPGSGDQNSGEANPISPSPFGARWTGRAQGEPSAVAARQTREPPVGSLCLNRPKPFVTCVPQGQLRPGHPLDLEMEGSRTGTCKGKRMSKSCGYSAPISCQDQVRKVVILPQDALAAFQSVPVLCLNSMADGLCSARDFHNVKYALVAAKAIPPRDLPLNIPPGHHLPVCPTGGRGESPNATRCQPKVRREQRGKEDTAGVKSFGGTSVRVATFAATAGTVA